MHKMVKTPILPSVASLLTRDQRSDVLAVWRVNANAVPDMGEYVIAHLYQHQLTKVGVGREVFQCMELVMKIASDASVYDLVMSPSNIQLCLGDDTPHTHLVSFHRIYVACQFGCISRVFGELGPLMYPSFRPLKRCVIRNPMFAACK